MAVGEGRRFTGRHGQRHSLLPCTTSERALWNGGVASLVSATPLLCAFRRALAASGPRTAGRAEIPRLPRSALPEPRARNRAALALAAPARSAPSSRIRRPHSTATLRQPPPAILPG